MNIARWVAGPQFTLSIHAAAAPTPAPEVPAPTPLPDVVPAFSRVDEELRGTFFEIPSFDVSASNPVQAIRTYFVPSGTAVEDTVDAYLNSSLVYTEKEVSGFNGIEVEVPFPAPGALADGDYVGRPFFGYQS